MICSRLVGAAAIAGALLASGVAQASGPRIVVSGPPSDPLAKRVQKELVAMGFEPIALDATDGCARPAVSRRIEKAAAAASTCSDGEAVSVWVMEPSGLRLREVVVLRSQDAAGRDVAAVRAVEIARASLALPDPEGVDPAPPAPAPAPIPEPAAPPPPASPPGADRPAQTLGPITRLRIPPPIVGSRTPMMVLGLGISGLMGIDATVTALGGQIEIGVTRWLAIAARAEIPLDSDDAPTPRSGSLRLLPGFGGAGVVLPLLPPSAFLIPRVGAGVGVAWVRASADDGNGNPLENGGVTIASPAAYANGALSLRVVGPLRVTAEALIGTTGHRMVVRGDDDHVAYWGQPFGVLALRAEVVIK